MADEQFYTMLTATGKAKITNAAVFNKPVTLTTLKLGDGNGEYYNPTEDQTSLKNTVYTCSVGSTSIDEDNSNWIVVETTIPGDVGGFTIREAGLYDDAGDLIAITKYPETYKPIVSSGATKDLCIRIILEVTNASNVTLSINPSVIIATKEDINNLQEQITKNIQDIAGWKTYNSIEELGITIGEETIEAICEAMEDKSIMRFQRINTNPAVCYPSNKGMLYIIKYASYRIEVRFFQGANNNITREWIGYYDINIEPHWTGWNQIGFDEDIKLIDGRNAIATDANLCGIPGRKTAYRTDSTTLNTPYAEGIVGSSVAGIIETFQSSSSYGIQIYYMSGWYINRPQVFIRYLAEGIWGDWVPLSQYSILLYSGDINLTSVGQVINLYNSIVDCNKLALTCGTGGATTWGNYLIPAISYPNNFSIGDWVSAIVQNQSGQPTVVSFEITAANQITVRAGIVRFRGLKGVW